jgi:hypothetical protein
MKIYKNLYRTIITAIAFLFVSVSPVHAQVVGEIGLTEYVCMTPEPFLTLYNADMAAGKVVSVEAFNQLFEDGVCFGASQDVIRIVNVAEPMLYLFDTSMILFAAVFVNDPNEEVYYFVRTFENRNRVNPIYFNVPKTNEWDI